MAVSTANHRDTLPNSIDMSTLSHSDLHSLSLLSNSSFFSSFNTVAAVEATSNSFNKSESSHRQTYSATPHHYHHRHHRHVTNAAFSDQYRSESVSIVNYLKKYLEARENVTVEIVNRNGEVVDLTALEDGYSGDCSPFDEELRRRTEGKDMEREEEVLEVLRSVEGKWCSARKKRKIIDASLLGDALPIGWKVIVALRRKGGRFTPYCRRYISPTGEHLTSCKEVSSYLKSYFGIKDTKHLRDTGGELKQLQWVNPNNDTSMLDFSNPSSSNTCLLIEHKKDVSVSGIDYLPEVQVQDLYECHPCNISFDAKDTYSQHMLSTHEKTTKKFRLDSSVGEQVAVRNENYECEICRMIFDDRNNYLEHLHAIHKKKTKEWRLPVAEGVISSVGDEVTVHNGNYECETCRIVFDDRKNYLEHLHAIHKKKTKKRRLPVADGEIKSVGDEVTVRNGNYECETCRIVFDDRNNYLEHLLAIHKKKTKKRKLHVADGVIKIDGKYGCQFCDKVFEEWRRYLGHLGNHVKGSIKSTKGSVPQVDRLATKIDNSKMDALAEIAQSSIQDISPTVLPKGPACVSFIDQLCMAMNGNLGNSDFFPEKYPTFCADDAGVEKASSPVSKQCTKEDGKHKARLKKSLSPSKKPSKKLIKDKTPLKKSLPPCLDGYELEKDGVKARAIANQTVMHSSDKMRENTMSNGIIIDLNVEKDGRQQKTSSKLKSHAQTSLTSITDGKMKNTFIQNEVNLAHNSCIDAMSIPAIEGEIQADYSIGNWAVKSISIEEDGSAEKYEGGFQISFVQENEKPSDMESAVERIQSECMDKHEPEHVKRNADSNLASVTGDAPAFDSNRRVLLSASSPFDDILEKAGQNICSLDPNLENGNTFNYMKLDEIEPQMYKYNALNEEDSLFLPVEKDTDEFNLGFNASTNPESQFPETMETTIMACVWCGLEFFNEVIDVEPQSDSVGFMCPVCRAKISKQFNELETNFSVTTHY